MRKNNDPSGSPPKRRCPSHFNIFAPVLAKNGFTVIPTSGKNPVTPKWQNPRPTDIGWLMKMVRQNRYADNNVGIVCGRVVGIDIDADEQKEADRLKALAFGCFGETKFIRVGRAPRSLLLYRPVDDIASTTIGCIDILALGKQFVAYGIHPDTGKTYEWSDSRHNPATARIETVPEVSGTALREFIEAVASRGGPTDALPNPVHSVCEWTKKSPTKAHQRGRPRSQNSYNARIVRDTHGLVIEGREAFLAKLISAGYGRGEFNTPDDLAKAAWAEFSANADLSRPKGSKPSRRWTYRDALARARSTCRKKPDLKSPRRPVGRHPTMGLNVYRLAGHWTVERRKQHVAEVARHERSPSVIAVARTMIDAVAFDTGFCTTTIAEIARRSNCSVTAAKNARRKLNKGGFWISVRGVYVPIPHRDLERAQAPQSNRKKASAGQPESRPAPEHREGQLTQNKEKKRAAGHLKVAPMYHLVTVSGGAVKVDGDGMRVDGLATASAPSAPPSQSGPVATSSARPPYQPDLFEGQGIGLRPMAEADCRRIWPARSVRNVGLSACLNLTSRVRSGCLDRNSRMLSPVGSGFRGSLRLGCSTG
jgi:hypothetical protein